MYGTYLAGHAADYLAAPKSRPFFLYVSFHETHSPFAFPVEYWGRRAPEEFPAPEVSLDDWDRLPLVFRDLTAADRRGVRAAYATSAEFLDKNVGLVLAALGRSPHRENTLVLFTSDHGYFTGQRGRFEKHSLWEPAVRAALVVRPPGYAGTGRATAALVELVDLLPTVLEFCGAPVPGDLHGRTLGPLLRGEADRHRDRVFAEYAEAAEAMLRTERWKLIFSAGRRARRDGYDTDAPPAGPSAQLFDLENDPAEATDLAGLPEHAGRVAEMVRELADLCARTARGGPAAPVDLADALAPPEAGRDMLE